MAACTCICGDCRKAIPNAIVSHCYVFDPPSIAAVPNSHETFIPLDWQPESKDKG